MLRIQRRGNGEVVLTVHGRVEADNVSELSALITAELKGRPVVLDLKEVVLVDRDVIKVLKTYEAEGVELRNCPPFIRSWITQEARRE